MSTTISHSPTSHVRFGHARIDMTPPVGIYHPMWGAARHHRATGVHRPLLGDVMALGAMENGDAAATMLRVQLDLVGMGKSEFELLLDALSRAAGLNASQIVVSFSHTHAAGLFTEDRIPLPGGELIPAYLETLREQICVAAAEAIRKMQPCTITYGAGRCHMAANRDYWDVENNLYACGFNPDAPADDTVIVGRVCTQVGVIVASLVNYACHPTTLAWENTQISPDYVGAMRAVVEAELGAPCIFMQGACGDLGPRHSHQGSTAVADQNGRQLGYAALSALTALDPPATDFAYAGPVISGATLGTWRHAPFDAERTSNSRHFHGDVHTLDLPMKPRPDPVALRQEMEDWLGQQAVAVEQGDAVAARDFGARAERARRWIMRVAHLPAEVDFPLPCAVHRLGDAIWVAVGGEPYNILQTELRRRFPAQILLISPLLGPMQAAYLLPEAYGQGLYQEEPSILAPGCLESLIEHVSAKIIELQKV
ncbi:MAG: hypothetical protein R2911_04485 [Caldilineaceae bacterium]